MVNTPAVRYFRAGLILMAAALNLSSALTAWGAEKPSAIQVEERSFFSSDSGIENYHGYHVFRCKLTNTDVKQPHTAVLTNSGATRTVQLAPGETQIVSFIASPAPGYYSCVEISFSDSKDTQRFSSYSCPRWEKSNSAEKVGEPISVLICRSLRKAFLTCECRFADKDCRYWPTNRLDYSTFDMIVLTLEELAAAPEKVQQAIYHFVLSGGTLYIFNAEEHKNLQTKISWLESLSQQVNPELIPAIERGEVKLKSNQDAPFEEDSTIEEETEADSEEDSSEEKTETLKNKWLLISQYPLDAKAYNAGFGSVYLCGMNVEKYLSETGVSDVHFINRLACCGIVDLCGGEVWFAEEPPEETHGLFSVVDNLDIPRRGIGVAMILFVILAGPINIFILSRRNQRILLLVTVPILSFIFAGGIVLYVMAADGFQTDIRVCSTTCLDQRNSTASSIAQVGYYARTSPRNLIFDINTELQPFTEVPYYQRSSEASSNRVELLPGTQVFSSGWVKPRTPTYFRVRKTETTRLKMSFDFNSASPSAVNGLGRDAALLYVRDAQGKLWKAEELKAGQKVLLTPVKSGEKSALLYYNNELSANQALLRNRSERFIVYSIRPLPHPTPYSAASQPLAANENLPKADYNSRFQSYFLRSDWYEQTNLANNDLSQLSNNSYVVLMKNAGPFIEKGISYAREKDCQTVIYGLY